MTSVTVVMATLNARHLITAFVRRYREEVATLGNAIELIVVDGGSHDGTTSAVLDAIPTATILTQPGAGIYASWNAGVRVARGKWILFYGADDLPGRGWLKRLSDADDNVDLVYGNLRLFTDDGFSVAIRSPEPGTALADLATHLSFPHVGLAHNSALFSEARFDESFRIIGDYEFLRRVRPTTAAYLLDSVQGEMRLGGVSNTPRGVDTAWAEHLRINPAMPTSRRLRWSARRLAARVPGLFQVLQRCWHRLRSLHWTAL
jgi:glycosyltransferase involved in cell wall biosynthesis